MSRPLRAVLAAELLSALRDALSGDGPAVFAGEPSVGIPDEVPQRVAVVVATSGSTGKPKLVALSADALLASAAASDTALGGPGQWLLALPAHYIAGVNVLIRSLASQTDPVVMAPERFTPERFVSAAAHLSAAVRFTSLVPTQLARLIEADAALATLRRFDRILVGGQAAPTALIASAIELGINVTRSYGSSETSGGCVYDGVPIGNTELRISSGRVEIAGSVLAEGYLADQDNTARDSTAQDSTAQAFRTEAGRRWFRTDDAGFILDGVLTVTGRTDDVIISGGIKVSIAAVELLVRSIPGQADAVVVSAPSAEWGEVPVVVATRPMQLEELRSFVVARLGSAAAPARVVVVDELPGLPSGKPDRTAIRLLVLQ